MEPAASRPTLIALIVATAFFMENLDGTVIATALPQMSLSLGVGTIQLSIGITAYLLTLAIFIPASGWMADRFGTRNVFGGAILLFTLSSIACGMAEGFYSFIAARIVQGTAAALMSPVGRLVVLRSTEKHNLLRAAAITVWPGLLAPVIGPPLGGFITTYATWRWIFFLNVPLGILGIFLVLRFVGNYRHAEKRPFDGKGFALTGTALGLLMYGFDRVGVRDWSGAAALIVLGIVAGAFAVRHLKHVKYPLVELSAMRVKSFSISVWGGVMFRMTVGATPVLLPLLFQRGFGLTAFASGGLTLAYAAGNLGMKPFTTPILRWFGYRTVMNVNALLSAMCILACGFLVPNTPVWLIATLLVLTGGFRSLGLTCLFTLPYVDVSAEQRSAATTMMSVVQQAGFGLGVAFSTVALQVSLIARGANADALTLADFRIAFAAVAALGAVVLLHFARLAPDAGAEVSGHGAKRRLREAPAD
jgi:EmrB/QacA subfamily drug resistance transporter